MSLSSSMPESSPLMCFLRDRRVADTFSAEEWSLMLAEALHAGMLARIAHWIPGSSMAGNAPPRHQGSLAAALIQSAAFRRDVQRELRSISSALVRVEAPVLLLKGASYVALGLPVADGRVFSDIDLLVAGDQIPLVESELMLGGWITGQLDPYDDRYYRQWSHEIPPMTHTHRGTTIDLHHSLVMPTCRIAVDSSRMIDDAVPIAGSGHFWRLRDEDVLLHAAAHLLLNGEFNRGLRDLCDIDLLFRHFSAVSAEFPKRLVARSAEVGLETILRQALYLARNFFSTPVDERLLRREPTTFVTLVEKAVYSRHPDTRMRGQKLADWLLMVREMSLRLPPNLLLIHLLHKMWVGFQPVKRVQA
ncbi:MAG: nucleotidyltransferase family protein [Dechloromonas sp.]|jgi:hypothetical protein|nr:nucleotidyltransferase family protein [Dechloromonas sp.]